MPQKLRRIVRKYTKIFAGFHHRGDITEAMAFRFFNKSGEQVGVAQGSQPYVSHTAQLKAMKTDFEQDKKWGYKPKDDKIASVKSYEKHDPSDKKKAPWYDPDVHKTDKLHQELVHHYRDYNDEHREAIQSYTGTGSKPMNKLLLGRSNYPSHEHWQGQIDSLKDALVQHTTPHAMAIHTGLTHSQVKAMHDAPAENKQGHFHLQFPGFTSASISRGQAHGFTREDDTGTKHLLTIQVPKGAHGGYVDHESANSGEQEFITHPGMKVHVDRQPHVTKNTVNWIGRMVHDGVKPLEGEHSYGKKKKT